MIIIQRTSGSLWNYYRDEPASNNDEAIIDFPAADNNSDSSKFKTKITRKAGNDDTKNVKIMVPLK